MFSQNFLEFLRFSLVPIGLVTSFLPVLMNFTFWWIPLGMFLLEGLRHSVKTTNTYFAIMGEKQSWPFKTKGMIFFYIFFVEQMNVFARVLGFIVGALDFRGWRTFREKAREYLSDKMVA